MTRDEFKSHVAQSIEDSIRLAEQKIGKSLPRQYCYSSFGDIFAKRSPIPQEQVVDALTDQVYVDSEHIYPCFDLGVGDLLDDGRILLTGNRAGYPAKTFGKSWTGREGPFVLIIGQNLLDRFKA